MCPRPLFWGGRGVKGVKMYKLYTCKCLYLRKWKLWLRISWKMPSLLVKQDANTSTMEAKAYDFLASILPTYQIPILSILLLVITYCPPTPLPSSISSSSNLIIINSFSQGDCGSGPSPIMEALFDPICLAAINHLFYLQVHVNTFTHSLVHCPIAELCGRFRLGLSNGFE